MNIDSFIHEVSMVYIPEIAFLRFRCDVTRAVSRILNLAVELTTLFPREAKLHAIGWVWLN